MTINTYYFDPAVPLAKQLVKEFTVEEPLIRTTNYDQIRIKRIHYNPLLIGNEKLYVSKDITQFVRAKTGEPEKIEKKMVYYSIFSKSRCFAEITPKSADLTMKMLFWTIFPRVYREEAGN